MKNIDGLSKINIEDPTSWKSSQFRKILNSIREIDKSIFEENKELMNKLKKKLLSELSFLKHLKEEDSIFIKSLIEGD